MRLLSTIISIYIFALFTLPCTDSESCADNGINHTSTHHEDDHEELPCSAFCACDCCGNRSIEMEYSFVLPKNIAAQIEKTTIPYQSPFHSQFNASIWQPPKLA